MQAFSGQVYSHIKFNFLHSRMPWCSSRTQDKMFMWTKDFYPAGLLCAQSASRSTRPYPMCSEINRWKSWIITTSLSPCLWQSTLGRDNCPCTCQLMNIITRYFPFTPWLIVTTFLCWVADKLPLRNDTVASLLSTQLKTGLALRQTALGPQGLS